MKYTVQKLDGRFSHNKMFEYYIGFSSSMNHNHGPLEFTNAQLWCAQTWGWSAEINIWQDIYRYHTNRAPMIKVKNGFVRAAPDAGDLPAVCNTNWSWTNGAHNGLRIYLATEKELGFFQLAHVNTT